MSKKKWHKCFYVPEDFVFNSTDECLAAYPDQAVSVLWNHPGDEEKDREIDRRESEQES